MGRVIVAILLALLATVARAALPACSSGQVVYTVGTGPFSAIGAATPAGACLSWLNSLPYEWDYVQYSEGYCMVQNTSGGGSNTSEIVKACEPEEAHWSLSTPMDRLTGPQVQKYMELFGAFLVAAVAVLALKSVYNMFRVDHHHG